MAEIYNIDYAANHLYVSQTEEYFADIKKDLKNAFDLADDVNGLLFKVLKLFSNIVAKDKTNTISQKYKAFGELLENTYINFNNLYKNMFLFYKEVCEEVRFLGRITKKGTISCTDFTHLKKLDDNCLDYFDLNCEAFIDEIKYYKELSSKFAEDVRGINESYKKGEDFSNKESLYQRGDLRVVK